MKMKSLVAGLAFATGLTAAAATQAEGKIYVGALAGLVDFDAPGFDRAFNAGVYGGYHLLGKDAHWSADLAGGTLSAEGQVTLSLVKGDAGAAGDWDITSIAAYAAYRHPLTDYFYLKGKLGLVRYKIDTDLNSPFADSDTALSAGIGAGWKLGPGRIEAELATHEGDAWMLSAGFHMNF
jgi:hypothetical protein